MMPLDKALIAVLIMSAVTYATRATPFLVFGGKDKTPPSVVLYLGKYLPPAIISCIIIYAFRNTGLTSYPYGLPEVLAVLVVVVLHLWKRNTMLTIFAGTGIYMWLVQFMFK